MLKLCLICGKEFNALQAEVNRGRAKFCSPNCRHKHQSNIMKGHKMKPEAKEKLIKALKNHKRTKEHSENISKGLIGKYIGSKNFNWKGGQFKAGQYIYIRCENNPRILFGGYVKRCNLNAEKILGRYLKKGEIVHHINKNTEDDRPENLYIFSSQKEHNIYHKRFEKFAPIIKSNLHQIKSVK